MTKHKWHDEIVAWANGAEIEYQIVDNGTWFLSDSPAWWINDFKFRVKKEPVISVCYFTLSKDGYSHVPLRQFQAWDLKITYQDGKAIEAELPT